MSTCVVALLLASLELLMEFVPTVSEIKVEHEDLLTVLIRKGEREKIQEIATSDVEDVSLPQEQAVVTEKLDIPEEVALEENS